MRHLLSVENIDRSGSNWPLGTKMCTFDPQIWIFGAKSHFFNRNFCQQGISPVCLGLQLSHSDYPEKNSISELWVIFRGSPLFLVIFGLCHFISISTLSFGLFLTKLGGTVRAIKKMTKDDNGPGPGRNYWDMAVFGHSHVRGATTLNFGPNSTKLGGIVRVIKKMTKKDNGPGPGRNYGETGVFTFGRKAVFGLKMGFTPKNHPKWHFPPSLFGQRRFFSLNNFFRLWPEHGEPPEVAFFLGPKFRFLVQKSDFCHTTPILFDDTFLALTMMVYFPPWEQFFNFPFRS